MKDWEDLACYNTANADYRYHVPSPLISIFRASFKKLKTKNI